MTSLFHLIDQNDPTTISTLITAMTQNGESPQQQHVVLSTLLLQQLPYNNIKYIPVQYACEKGFLEIFDLS